MKTDSKENRSQAPIAIIGMGCFFAKSQGLKEYWRLLLHGVDGITEVPDTHWSAEDYYDEDPKKPDHLYCKRGGFISPVSFDPVEFGIPPSSLEATDTSQLLGLVAAKMALDNSGYGNGREFDRDGTSVILGVTGTQELVIPLSSRLSHPVWRKALTSSDIPQEKSDEIIRKISGSYVPWQENSFPGLLGNVVAGRISNRLDLGGTNCVVDAACASSMSAIHLGVMELLSGRSSMVVSGGVDTLNDVFMHMCFAKSSVLSPSGDARPFSASADGTVLGEGIGIVILKRLQDAERDGDRVYAVLKAVGSSSDGKSQSIYAPRAEGQAKALRMAYKNAGIDPSTVELVEAHGTGTRVGDAVEFKALNQVFGGTSKNGSRCALGSVKSMIGHTKAAAGSAGLIKAALSLYHKVLPPTLKAENPDPEIRIDESPFYLNPVSRPWFKHNGHPRRSGVSSFGFGGSNFHTVLEEYRPDKPVIAWDNSVQIFAFSEASEKDLINSISRFRSEVENGLDAAGIAYAANRSRQNYSSADACRLLLVYEFSYTSTSDLQTLFSQAVDSIVANQKASPPKDAWQLPNIFYGGPGKIADNKTAKVAFLFPGQGSQYVNMGRDLVCCFPAAHAIVEKANAAFGNAARLSDFIYPCPVRSKEEIQAQEEALRRTDIAQPAIASINLAMLEILKDFGVTPDASCGHSFGELTALYASGWIDIDTLFTLAVLRGKFMAAAGRGDAGNGNNQPNGTMLAVLSPLDQLEALISGLDTEVVLANRNSLQQGIVSGREEDITAFEKACQAKGFKTKRLPVAAAFHSPLVKDAQKPFAQALKKVDIQPGSIPVFSNITGKPYPEDAGQARELLGQQLICPVDFVGEIENLYDMGFRTFVEVGPKAVLSGLVKSILPDHDIQTVALDASSGKHLGLTDLARALSLLASAGFGVDMNHWEEPPAKPEKQRMNIPLTGSNLKPKVNFGARVDNRAPAAEPASAQRPNSQSERDSESRTGQVSKEKSQFLKETLNVVQEGLKSIQALQLQTADTHMKFLDAQSETSRTLQEMMENVYHLTRNVLGIPASSEKGRSSPKQYPVKNDVNTLSNTAEEKDFHPGYSIEGPGPPQPFVSPEPSPETSEQKSSHHRDPDSRRQIENTLLEVVSQLTGYPAEMLGPDMDIEADLGIDSIKRVEILSTLEARLPNMPPVPPELMGSLKTMGAIVAYLSEQSGPVDQEIPAATVPEVAPEDGVDRRRIESILLEVVSQLTGYPAEMLGPDMDIEADLGIDSIKRVEILSTLEARLPNMPPVPPELMGSLKTMGAIVAYLSEQSGPVDQGTPAATVPEVAPEDGVDRRRIESTLLEVVSQLTGYPAEMLGSDMDIEADLGIDSIKRVEILSTLEARLPNMPPVPPELMGSLKTIGAIAAYLEKQAGVEQAEETPPSIANSAPDDFHEPDDNVMRHTVVRVEAPLRPMELKTPFPDGNVWITDDHSGLARSLATELKRRDIDAKVVSLKDLQASDDLQKAAGLIIVSDPEEPVCSGFLEKALLLAGRAADGLTESAQRGAAFFTTISRLDGAFGFNGKGVSNPLEAGLAGLAKTAAIEWENVCCRAIDIAPRWTVGQDMAAAVVDEILTPDIAGKVEVGLEPGHRWVLEMESSPFSRIENMAADLYPGDVVLITGGARGVTAEAALVLAEKTRATFILLGRSPMPAPEPLWLQGLESEADVKRAVFENEFSPATPTPAEVERTFKRLMANREIRTNLQRLKQTGARADYYSVDVRDHAAVNSLLDGVRADHGPVKALIHAAGVLEDRLIIDKTPEQFDRVFNTKVRGLEILLNATRQDPLKHLVLFSSVTARMGNKGQADYAMANEVLNKTAQQESTTRKNCRVVSINWGPWAGGMVTPTLKREFERRHVDLIPLRTGAMCMYHEMMKPDAGPVEIVVGEKSIHPPDPMFQR